MLFFGMVFVMLIGASVYQGNEDQITPNIARAQADMAIGTAPVQVLEKGASWLLKLIGGATFTGILAFVFTESRKIYQLWKRNSMMKRWQGGPNGQWQTAQPKELRLTPMEKMMLLLAGRQPENTRINPMPGMSRPSTEEDGIELEF